jgi:DNA helicase-2/ATP-dependent DNA helicase PcrA
LSKTGRPGGAGFAAGLNERQAQAVAAIEGPVLIIAGAGSGKTRVITCRAAAMLEQGIPQSAILALTFTNKAAREMETRVKELTSRKLQNLTTSTFHAFGVKILREEIAALGYRKNFSIYDEADRAELIRQILRELGREGAADPRALGQVFSQVKTGCLAWGDGADPSFEAVYEEYQESLKVFNALDFDDLLAKPIALFESRPDILDKYRRRFRYIMVDEFQDTSAVQYRLMRLLADRNVCVVGDDDQSIYSWRGANYENIQRFERDFPGALEIKLEQNYRSTATILEAANGVIAHNTKRKEKTLWSGGAGGKPISLYTFPGEGEEAAFIALEIKKRRLEEGRSYDDFGVLIRTNSLIRHLEEALLAENIPHKISGGTSFFQRTEIKDVLSYLRVAANTDDDVNLLRIINTPRRGIGKTTIAAVSERAKEGNLPLWEAMRSLRYARDALFPEMPGDGCGGIDEFMTLIERWRENLLGKRGLSQKVRALVDEIDYWGYLVSEYRKDEQKARWKFSNIGSLIQSIGVWERDPDNLDPTLYPYLNRISLLSRDDADDGADKGKVNVMTIHASKGLEFPVVFIAGAEDGIIPHARSLEEGEANIEEERRLFYVAITRARDKLVITSCARRRRQQSALDQTPSPFLAEIPAHLVEYGEARNEEPMSAERCFALMKQRFQGR